MNDVSMTSCCHHFQIRVVLNSLIFSKLRSREIDALMKSRKNPSKLNNYKVK